MSDPAAPLAAPARVRLPDAAPLLERRAARLAALAEGHAAPEWVRLLSRIAWGQARAARQIPLSPIAPLSASSTLSPSGGEGRGKGVAPLASRDPLSLAPAGGEGRGEGVAPLAGIPRDAAWRRMLAMIVDAAGAPGLPAPARDALSWLAAAPADRLEPLADAVLAGTVPGDLAACAPFVGAALEAWLASLAAQLGPGATAASGDEGACPACGGPPVAGTIGAEDRLRWLACARCATAWNVPRVRCVACETATGPEYFHLDSDPGAKAEACPDCRAYVKLFDLAKRPGSEPAADDAATLALDLLLAEEGFHRAGPNVYVGAGEASSPAATDLTHPSP